MINSILNEELFDIDNQQTGPTNTVDASFASQVVDLLKDNLNLIDKYNSLRTQFMQMNKDDLLFVIDDLSSTCTEAVGELQGLLKIFQPNAENIDKGEDEVLKMM